MRFWKSGDFDPDSNVQFGEGGAGTFSDGKLTCGKRHEKIAVVLETRLRETLREALVSIPEFTGETRTIDGVNMQFQMVSGTEAPSPGSPDSALTSLPERSRSAYGRTW